MQALDLCDVSLMAMDPLDDSSRSRPVPDFSVAEYYAGWTDLGVLRLQPGGGLQRLHVGLWGSETKTPKEAWQRATETLVEGCNLVPGTRVLDAGCGLGATAITLAETFGVQVTGMTICEPHVALAVEQAEQRGVAHLVDFRYGDFMDLPFSDASFDVVLNQESFLYAHDKLAYLRGVHRVLRPNGRWQCIDGLRSDKILSEAEEEIHTAICEGFNTFAVPTLSSVFEVLKEAGFVGIRDRDLSLECARAIERIRTMWFLFGHLMPGAEKAREAIDTFVATNRAGMQGWLSYRLVCGVRPPADE